MSYTSTSVTLPNIATSTLKVSPFYFEIWDMPISTAYYDLMKVNLDFDEITYIYVSHEVEDAGVYVQMLKGASQIYESNSTRIKQRIDVSAETGEAVFSLQTKNDSAGARWVKEIWLWLVDA